MRSYSQTIDNNPINGQMFLFLLLILLAFIECAYNALIHLIYRKVCTIIIAIQLCELNTVLTLFNDKQKSLKFRIVKLLKNK